VAYNESNYCCEEEEMNCTDKELRRIMKDTRAGLKPNEMVYVYVFKDKDDAVYTEIYGVHMPFYYKKWKGVEDWNNRILKQGGIIPIETARRYAKLLADERKWRLVAVMTHMYTANISKIVTKGGDSRNITALTIFSGTVFG